ncbi:translation initiation factor IF-2-like [Mustela putorius furo]|uniref:Translation initiation factor IF-2-like n=1 Tax=Mustela putorius furo TaxID=9669 RepID=A0A8U0S1R0_MUSPF|nr:translation initiation factor IF-2-like [Mustela putorius furo]
MLFNKNARAGGSPRAVADAGPARPAPRPTPRSAHASPRRRLKGPRPRPPRQAPRRTGPGGPHDAGHAVTAGTWTIMGLYFLSVFFLPNFPLQVCERLPGHHRRGRAAARGRRHAVPAGVASAHPSRGATRSLRLPRSTTKSRANPHSPRGAVSLQGGSCARRGFTGRQNNTGSLKFTQRTDTRPLSSGLYRAFPSGDGTCPTGRAPTLRGRKAAASGTRPPVQTGTRPVATTAVQRGQGGPPRRDVDRGAGRPRATGAPRDATGERPGRGGTAHTQPHTRAHTHARTRAPTEGAARATARPSPAPQGSREAGLQPGRPGHPTGGGPESTPSGRDPGSEGPRIRPRRRHPSSGPPPR